MSIKINVSGTVDACEIKTSKGGKPYADIVLELPKDGDRAAEFVSLSAFGKVMDDVYKLGAGDSISADCWLGADKYNGRVFNKVRLGQMTITARAAVESPADANEVHDAEPSGDDMPF